ncbi:uncharacterized protein EV422DRAFT_536648 [Fimicolochytrium jonesii]|uniref:uncharacterized protein n=1 Tax=Fimicolochytrium jonesii TaxID=1396493 RepID=UPI0022FEE04F|nr:uncharacterized protein EV422DRAFT_536648 [Fimicolochytrium jonesii]KAI8818735.1 hypothetical protein EV422DRAFT_536648 [Fimicolochytrium jonesii]
MSVDNSTLQFTAVPTAHQMSKGSLNTQQGVAAPPVGQQPPRKSSFFKLISGLGRKEKREENDSAGSMEGVGESIAAVKPGSQSPKPRRQSLKEVVKRRLSKGARLEPLAPAAKPQDGNGVPAAPVVDDSHSTVHVTSRRDSADSASSTSRPTSRSGSGQYTEMCIPGPISRRGSASYGEPPLMSSRRGSGASVTTAATLTLRSHSSGSGLGDERVVSAMPVVPAPTSSSPLRKSFFPELSVPLVADEKRVEEECKAVDPVEKQDLFASTTLQMPSIPDSCCGNSRCEDLSQQTHDIVVGGELRSATMEELTTLVAFGVVLPSMEDAIRIGSAANGRGAQVSLDRTLGRAGANGAGTGTPERRRSVPKTPERRASLPPSGKEQCGAMAALQQAAALAAGQAPTPTGGRSRRYSLPGNSTLPNITTQPQPILKGSTVSSIRSKPLPTPAKPTPVIPDTHPKSAPPLSNPAIAALRRGRVRSNSNPTPPTFTSTFDVNPSSTPKTSQSAIAKELPNFERELNVRMRASIYLAGEYIIRKNEIGREMFFIGKGRVEVVSGDGMRVYGVIGAGSFFGELGVLFDIPRTASVRALENTLCMVLSRDDLKEALKGFPSISARFQTVVEQRMALIRARKQSSPQPTVRVNKGITAIQEDLEEEE